MLTALKRIFQPGWRSFSRDGSLVWVTVFVFSLTILLVSSLFLSKLAGNFLIASLQNKVDISVFFKENSNEEDILNVKSEISQIPEVKEVLYVSKEKALEDFSLKHRGDEILISSLREVGGNPFLAALNIKAFDASQYGAIANFLQNPALAELIEKTDYFQRKNVIERIFYLTSIAGKAGIFLSIILIIVAFLVSFNTVRLAILHFGEEIKIQRLVGATNFFIRGPFLAQGLIAGLVSAVISFFVFGITIWFLSPQVEFFFEGLSAFSMFISRFWQFLFLQVGVGLSLGFLSSWLAVRKYLRV